MTHAHSSHAKDTHDELSYDIFFFMCAINMQIASNARILHIHHAS